MMQDQSVTTQNIVVSFGCFRHHGIQVVNRIKISYGWQQEDLPLMKRTDLA